MPTAISTLQCREASVYRPHPFSWVPAENQRHATTAWHVASGATFEALCGATWTADQTDEAWLWETCPHCRAAANTLAKAANR